MMKMTKLSKKVLSVFLCLALMMTYLPVTLLTAAAAVADYPEVADASTLDGWKAFFLPADGSLNTENAGGIWTDKSVFTDASAFQSHGITMKDKNSLLVALSAIGSNMTVMGASEVPTDTMLVLDVSGSMDYDRNGAAGELVEAANTSIATLLAANPENRVGVVLYADGSTLMLPLGRYATGTDGQFFNYTYDEQYDWWTQSTERYNEAVELDADVVIEGTTSKPYSGNRRPSRSVSGGTYIQHGVDMAADQFTATSNSTTAASGAKRKPVVVLMSDGAPTYGTNSVLTPGDRNMGNGSTTTAGLAFVNQLTISNVKNTVTAKYGNECLIYTLGLGTGTDELATSVLNPGSTAQAVLDLWEDWELLAVGGTLRVQRNPSRSVSKVDGLNHAYVKGYFDSANYTAAGSLGEALKQAFADIIAEIELQASYYPTLVQGDEDFSGYISFVDKIGQYMNVTDVKGLLVGDDVRFSGADMASKFAPGNTDLGTVDRPTALGDELVWAVQTRLGLATTDEARTLIGLAYEYGQLGYTDADNWSNYIGWCADASGKFLGFWDESLDPATFPAGTVYAMKSYGYLGEVNAHLKSDMMYATVQVREDLATGEQQVTFAIPATLIPIVSYKVTLDETGVLKALDVNDTVAPIRLVYEVALDLAINPYTVKEIVSQEYLNRTDDNGNKTNVNADGSINFFTNQYEVNADVDGNLTGYNKVNTYSYFRPSRENDRHYYQQDELVYSDASGTLYKGDAQPSGTMYHGYTVYTKSAGGVLETQTFYHQLTAETLLTTERTSPAADTTWYIPTGDVRRDYAGYLVNKTSNASGTLPFSAAPFTDIRNHNVDDLDHSFVVGVTMANNGRITVTPETGIKISKALAADATPTTKAFTFRLTNDTDPTDNATYPVYKNGVETQVTFSGGAAQVSLAPGEVLYIGGMPVGERFLVEEVDDVDYVEQSVNGDIYATDVMITIAANELQDAAFVNADRGRGSLSIAKEIELPAIDGYAIPADKKFTLTVTLEGVGIADMTSVNATYTNATNLATPVSIPMSGGVFAYVLGHNEQLLIENLPAGTVATVVENAPGTGFTAAYWDNGVLGDGQVEILADNRSSVIVVNDYDHVQDATPVNIAVSGTKTLSGRPWEATDSFTFRLEKWNPVLQQYEAIPGVADAVVNGSSAVGTDDPIAFNFTNAFGANEVYTDVGTYLYRVVELEPTPKIDGVSYDKTVHSFGVVVTDEDLDGALEIKDVHSYRVSTVVTPPATSGDNYEVVTNFTNTYSTTGTATVTIDLNKQVNNVGSNGALSGFRFGLYDGTAEVAVSEATNDRGFSRLVLDYVPADLGGQMSRTFNYTIKEIVPDPVPKGWNYSTQVIPVTIELESAGGQLVASVYTGTTAPATPGTAAEATFINTYNPLDTELPINFVSKELSGRAQKDDEFFFAVYDYTDTARLNPLSVGSNKADGSVVFNNGLPFDAVGNYFYDIIEVYPDGSVYKPVVDGNGIVADKSVRRMMVQVTDNAGQLVATPTLVNATDHITFRNAYTAAATDVTITAKKTLTGRTLINDEFTFILQELDALGQPKGNPVVAHNTVIPGTNTGEVVFPKIVYTTPGTYTYKVTEQQSAGADYGIRFSNAEYIVRVEVTDNGLGQLERTVYVNNSLTTPMEFVNIYEPEKATANLLGNKALVGKILGGGDYSFQLIESNASWAELNPMQTKPNAVDGSIVFDPFDLTEAKPYYYLVKEVNGGQTIKGVTYDDTVFRVTINVTDNLMGDLVPSVSITDQAGIPQQSITFVNTYEITGNDEVTLSGGKTLNGRAPINGEFDFGLYPADKDFVITGDALEKAHNADGKFGFQLEYLPENVGNTYYYVVKEIDNGIKGITYSDMQYTVAVEVKDDNEGGIATVVTVNNGTVAPTALDFINEFHAAASVEVAVDKLVENKGSEKITAEGFTFLLKQVDGAVNDSVKTDAEGKAVFTLNYTQADAGKVYTYEISEVNDGRAYVKYSDKVYTVTVAVTLNSDFDLETELKLDGKAVNSIKTSFVNEYDYSSEIPRAPQFGDNTNIALWFVLLFVSGGGIFGAAIYDRKKKEEQAE